MPNDLDFVRRVAADARHLTIVATARADGSVHASLVSGGVTEHPGTGLPSIGMVVGGSTLKLRLLRASGRATCVFQAGYQWVAVEGAVTIIGPDDTPGVPAGGLPPLWRAVFLAAGGTHDDWDEYDRVMAAERRAAVFVAVDHIMSNG